MSQKRHFVVADEHTLGCVNPKTPNIYGILRASIIKGACINDSDSWKFFSSGNVVRTATQADFESFRIFSKGYENDPLYDFPKPKGIVSP